MTPRLVIRKPEPEELPDIQAIADMAFAPYIKLRESHPHLLEFDFVGNLERGELYVVQDTRDIGAYIVTYRTERGQLIENVAVSNARKRNGLGRKAVNFAAFEAKRRKVPRVYLYTHSSMTDTLAFYEHLGYVRLNPEPGESPERVSLEKRLDQ